MVLAIYGHGGHLCRVTKTIFINLCSPFPRRLHIKFGFDWSSHFRKEENNGHILVYSQGTGADNPLWSFLLKENKHLLKIWSFGASFFPLNPDFEQFSPIKTSRRPNLTLQ